MWTCCGMDTVAIQNSQITSIEMRMFFFLGKNDGVVGEALVKVVVEVLILRLKVWIRCHLSGVAQATIWEKGGFSEKNLTGTPPPALHGPSHQGYQGNPSCPYKFAYVEELHQSHLGPPMSLYVAP